MLVRELQMGENYPATSLRVLAERHTKTECLISPCDDDRHFCPIIWIIVRACLLFACPGGDLPCWRPPARAMVEDADKPPGGAGRLSSPWAISGPIHSGLSFQNCGQVRGVSGPLGQANIPKNLKCAEAPQRDLGRGL